MATWDGQTSRCIALALGAWESTQYGDLTWLIIKIVRIRLRRLGAYLLWQPDTARPQKGFL